MYICKTVNGFQSLLILNGFIPVVPWNVQSLLILNGFITVVPWNVQSLLILNGFIPVVPWNVQSLLILNGFIPVVPWNVLTHVEQWLNTRMHGNTNIRTQRNSFLSYNYQ